MIPQWVFETNHGYGYGDSDGYGDGHVGYGDGYGGYGDGYGGGFGYGYAEDIV
jgi:hypothetical protein